MSEEVIENFVEELTDPYEFEFVDEDNRTWSVSRSGGDVPVTIDPNGMGFFIAPQDAVTLANKLFRMGSE